MTPLMAAAAAASDVSADGWIQFGILLFSLIGGIITVLWRISDMKSAIAGHDERIKATEKAIADLENIPSQVASMQSVCAERHGRRRSIKV
jgi:hypothetical protein